MKTKKANKLKMFNSLTKVMDGNKKIWSSIKEIEKAYKTFLDATNKLNLLKDEYDKDLTNLIDRKLFARKNIIIEAFPISNVIVAFGIENDQKKLVKKCNFSKSELRKAKDLELVDISKSIWKEAKKLYTSSVATPETARKNQKVAAINIHNYGLTGQMIDKLEIANVTLVEARMELNDAYEFKKQCKKKLTAGIHKNIALLKTKLDLLVTIFKASDPGFYNDYTKARSFKIESTKSISEKPKTKKNGGKSITKNLKSEENIIVKKDVSETKSSSSKIATSKKALVITSDVVPEIKKAENTIPVVKKVPVKKPAVRKPPIKKVVATKPVTETKAPENK